MLAAMWKEGALDEKDIVVFFVGILGENNSVRFLCSIEYKYIRKFRICIGI